LTPQSIHIFGGYKVQGKTPQAYEQLLKQAVALEETGVFMLVLEGVSRSLRKRSSKKLTNPCYWHRSRQICRWSSAG
jgi:3-methyl-2-oxobutanoate hydroxymethyltransferase